MTKKVPYNQVMHIFLIYLAGFAIGCVYMNVLWKTQNYESRNSRLFCLDEFLQSNAVSRTLFWQMLIGSGILFFLLFMSGFSKIGKIFARGVCLCAGTLEGALFTLTVLEYGIKKAGRLLLTHLPQALIFVPTFVFFVIIVDNMSTKYGVSEKISVSNKRKYAVLVLFCAALWFFGIILRCYVNPILLKILSRI